MRRLSTSQRYFRRRRVRSAFTLIELLAVIAIIAILAAIGLKIASGVREGAARDTARAQLAVLQGALEDYKRVFKAYPSADSGGALLRALTGQAGPDGAALNRRPFVSLTGLTLRDENQDAVGNVMIDPWDSAYVYRVFGSGNRQGFYLYSVGPDGADTPPGSDGVLDLSAASNLDNVYAHR
jgi:type II secretion system protein G